MADPEVTEAEMIAMLRSYVCKDSGNGPSAVLADKVRSAAGFDASRTIDAVGIELWPSRGMRLTGYEIKVSRADWLRELKNPAKAEEFASKLDFLAIVAADSSIVRGDELPEHWGLLVRHGNGLRSKVAPTLLHEGTGRNAPLPPGFDRSFLIALARATDRLSPDVWERLREDARKQAGYELEHTKARLAELEKHVAAFEEAAGVKIDAPRFGVRDGDEGTRFGAAFRAALEGDMAVRDLLRRADTIASMLERLSGEARELASGVPEGNT